MKTKYYAWTLKSIVVISLAIMLFSCKNNIKDIQAMESMLDTMPDVTAKDIEFLYTENGMVQVKLNSPLMNNFTGKKPYMEFPDGFKVIFYDSLQNEKTILTANYGINYQDRQLMEARGNVVVINHETNEQLNTEELIWDQKRELIYSNKFVKLTTESGVLYGEGIESDQTFSKRRLLHPTGDLMVEDDNPPE